MKIKSRQKMILIGLSVATTAGSSKLFSLTPSVSPSIEPILVDQECYLPLSSKRATPRSSPELHQALASQSRNYVGNMA